MTAGDIALLPQRAWVEQVMGLPMSVHVRGASAGGAVVDAAVGELFARLRAADERFSTYRADSEVMRRRLQELPASQEMHEVLALCAEARMRTGGVFDADLPGGFDPSGLVKGWAVERAAEVLRSAASGCDWLVNAGGDIVLHAEAGRSWRVGIEDPRDTRRTLRTFALTGGAIATSGHGRRGAHITDPRTGEAAEGSLLSATIIGPSLLWADVYATAAFVLGVDALAWVAGLAGQRALLVRPDGSLLSTAHTPTAPRRAHVARLSGLTLAG